MSHAAAVRGLAGAGAYLSGDAASCGALACSPRGDPIACGMKRPSNAPGLLSRSRGVRSIVLETIPGQRARGGEKTSQVPLTRELPIYWVPVRVLTHAGPADRTACGVLGTLPRSKHRDPIPVHRCMISPSASRDQPMLQPKAAARA